MFFLSGYCNRGILSSRRMSGERRLSALMVWRTKSWRGMEEIGRALERLLEGRRNNVG